MRGFPPQDGNLAAKKLAATMFECIFFIILIGIIIAAILGFKSHKPGGLSSDNDADANNNEESHVYRKGLLTEHEKSMFAVLKNLPGCHIFCQVSLGAILNTRNWKTRNKFSQKIADFVVTDHNLNILAVIELDDGSHDDKQAKDRARDNMLKSAGYNVLRYRKVPTPQQLAIDLNL